MDPDPDPHQNVMVPDPLVQRHGSADGSGSTPKCHGSGSISSKAWIRGSGSGSTPKFPWIRNTACLPHDDVAHLLEAGNDQASVVVVEARSAVLPAILQVAEIEEMHFCRRLEAVAVLKHLCFD
jgi:hypothetical protein